MTGFIERGAMTLARFIAGPKRRHWMDAMEAELMALDENKLDWALGSLVAAIKDRTARDWQFGLALGLLPALALVAVAPVTLITGWLSKGFGTPAGLATLGMLLIQLPFAYLLGRLRPQWNAFVVGAGGFAIHQLAPALIWKIFIGPGISLTWGPNMFWLGLSQALHLPVELLIWTTGCWLGASHGRAHIHKRLS